MKRVKRSSCEVPFVVTFEGRPVTGKIDRLCEIEDGNWVVIDYKTVFFISANISEVVEEYFLSISIYHDAARKILSVDVNVWLYFTELGLFWNIETK